MATLVDRPSSLLRESPVEPIIPQRRLREPEIIDVDSLDSDSEGHASSSSSVPVRRRVRARRSPASFSEVIELSDDDDSDQPLATGARLMSPPPRIIASNIPPVPPLPAHLAVLNSLPMRRRPPPHPTSAPAIVIPPVRAHDQPFDWERDIEITGQASRAPSSGPSRSRRSNQSADDNTPARQMPPRLGLGGALIASNNARLREERDLARRQQLAAYRRSQAVVYHRTMLAAARAGGHTSGRWDRDDELVDLFRGHVWAPFEPPRRDEVDYKAEYTHPDAPEAGFTFNFGPSEETHAGQTRSSDFPATSQENPIVIDDDEDEVAAGSSQGKGKAKAKPVSESPSILALKTLLVCSRCRDPLLLGESASKLGPTGEKSKRIWSLRCGHLIDGQCLDALSTPAPGEVDVLVDRKGKGKAVEPPDQPVSQASWYNPIRSRLRSFNESSVLLPDLLGSLKRKASTPKNLNTVEEEYHWQCPVAGCGREHVSVKVAGVWGPAKPEMGRGDGAIGVFV